jgi:hypothetical protein
VAQNVARQLARKFAQARLREQFYEWRIVISVHCDAANQFDPQASTIQGNADGFQLLGFSEAATVPWSTVRRTIGDPDAWPSVLEQAIPSITAGSLPPALPPFLVSGTVYIPVIVRAQSVDDVLKELVLIFVAVETDRLRHLLDWSLPKGMPDAFAMLVRLVRMMFRARWDILEPRYQELKYHSPTPERCAEIARCVLSDYGRMQQDSQTQGITGIDKFYGLFSRELRPEVEACGDEWVQLTDALRAAPPENSSALAGRLKALRDNNAKWLKLAARQLAVTTDDLL